MRTIIAAGVLLAVTIASAQVSSELIQVSHPADNKWYIHNLAKQAITGYVLHTGYGPLHFNATEINCAPAETVWNPIAPGATVEIPVKPGFAAVDIPAVIFEDGSVVGAARTAEGLDIVEAIFDMRRAEAQEFARWQRIVERSGLAAMRKAVVSAQLERPSGDMAGNGRAAAAAIMAGDIQTLDAQGSQSQDELYGRLLAKIQDRIEYSKRFSSRRAQ